MIGEETQTNPWLRRELIAPWWEIALVVAVVIGISAARSTWAAIHGSSHQFISMLLTDRRMIYYLAVEGGLLAFFLAYLHFRGWKRSDFCMKPGVVSTFQGVLLAAVMQLTNSAVVMSGMTVAYALQSKFSGFVSFLSSQTQPMQPHSIDVTWSSLIAAMILNAFFEELTCMGYIFTQIAAKQGPFLALVITVLLRMSCHSYQGLVHVLGIGMVFLVTGLVYWKTRNLWTLIVAHALVDIGSTGLVKIFYG